MKHHTVSSTPVLGCDCTDVVGVHVRKGGAHIMSEGRSSSSSWKGGAHHHLGRVELIIMLEGRSSSSCWKGGAHHHVGRVELNKLLRRRSSCNQLSATFQVHRFT